MIETYWFSSQLGTRWQITTNRGWNPVRSLRSKYLNNNGMNGNIEISWNINNNPSTASSQSEIILQSDNLIRWYCVGWILLVTPKEGRGREIVMNHDEVIKWKHFLRYWPFVWGIHRFPVNSPHKGQWRGALMFSLICVWINGRVNNRQAGDLRCYCAHYDPPLCAHHCNAWWGHDMETLSSLLALCNIERGKFDIVRGTLECSKVQMN